MKSVPRVFARLTAIRQSIHYPVIFLLLALSCAWQAYGGESNTLALTGPRSLQARFRGEDAVVRALASAHATPLSLAAEDFDMDGVRDLAAGYATPEGGRVAIFGGNLDAFAPQSEASFWAIGRGEFPLPFLPDVQVLAVPTQPDFLAAGMFIGHDGPGLIVAARGSNTIYVLARDESGQFQVQQTITLPGAITALGVARLNQGQYTEVVVGIRGASGAAALLRYTGSNDGLGQAQSVALADDAAGFAFGDLDGDGRQDVLVVAGGAVSILHTRDGSLEEVPVSFVVKAAALGSFVFDRSSLLQMALLGDDGSVHILVHESFDPRPRSLAERRERKRQNRELNRSLERLGSIAALEVEPVKESWKEIESFKAVATSGALLFRTRISDHRADDVLLLDGGRLLVIAHPDSKRDDSDGSFAPGVILTQAEPYTGPAAALMERVNVDGRAGIIVLAQGEVVPAVMMPLPDPTFTVNTTTDLVSANPNACLNAVAGQCSLRQAIIESNATGGTDTIMVPNGTYTLTLARNAGNHSNSLQGTLEVQDSVNIIGGGQNTTIIQGGTLAGNTGSPNGVDMVIAFNEDIDSTTNASVSISNLTIRNGFNRGNQAIQDGDGGGFEFDTGTGTATLTMTNCTVTNNGLNDGRGGGGALFNTNNGSGMATFTNSIIQNNDAHRNPADGIHDPNGAGNGGGLFIGFPAKATLNGTQVLNNTATQVQGTGLGTGGGIFKFGGGNLNLPLTIHGGAVSGNQSASNGGGIFSTAALTIDQGTVINGNTSGGQGGGVWFNSGNAGESASLTKVAITGNNASGTAGAGTGVGGGMYVGAAGNPATISFSRFAGNSSAVAGSNNLINAAGAPGSAVTATNNWWGTNAASTTISPSTSHCAAGAQQICFDPFIVLTHMGSPQKMKISQNATLTGDMSKDNHGTAVGLANLDRIIGLSITFDAPVLGTIPQAQPETLNASAQATATFNGGSTSGLGTAHATVDQAVVPVNSNLIASATESGTTATITTVGAHGFSTGEFVSISGVGVSGYNGNFFSITGTTTTTFTYIAGSSGLGASSGGTANAGIILLEPPSITKGFSPTTVPTNTPSTITFSITNANVVPINGSFTDTLPANLVVATTPTVINGCGGSVTATAGTGTISYTNAATQPVGTCTIKVNVQSAIDNVYANSVQILSSDAGNGNTSGPISLTVINPPVIAKAFGAATIPLNGSTSLTFTLSTTNVNLTLNGVAFTDNLPAGVVATSSVTNNCNGTASTANAGATVQLTGASLAGGAAQCTLVVTVQGTTAGVKNNSVQVTSSNAGNGNTAMASITVVAPPTINKAFLPTSIPVGGTSTVTFAITNPNLTVALNGLSFSDTLTGGLQVASTPNPGGTCANISLTAVAGTTSIVLNSAGPLAANTSCTVKVDVTGTVAGAQTNTTGAISSTEGGTGTTSNTANLAVLAPPTLSKAFNPASIPLSTTTQLTFTITNPAANTASLTGVGFTDTLPTGLTVATNTSSQCGGSLVTTNPTSIVLSGATVAVGIPCTFSVTVTGAVAGSYNNIVNGAGKITSTNGGTGVDSNTATLTVVTPPSIVKAFGQATISLNGTTSLTFTITNPNSAVTLNGLAFDDTLPAGLIGTGNVTNNGCGGTASLTNGGTHVVLTAGTLAGGAGPCTLVVTVQGTTAGVKNNSVQINSTEGGLGNTSNASVTVVSPPTISKSFTASSVPVGGNTNVNFTITNPNTATILTGVGFSDTLPAGLSVADASTATCGGTLTVTHSTGVISLSGATVAANNGTCTFSVQVTGITAGDQSNTTGAVTSTEGGTGVASNTAVLKVLAPPTLSKAFNPTAIGVGSTTLLMFTITNPAGNTASLTGVGFTDTLPTGLTVANGTVNNVCGTGTLTTTNPTGITLSGGTVAVGVPCTFSVTVTGAVSGTYMNTVNGAGKITSANGGTGVDSNTATLNVATPATIAKAFGLASIPLNGTTSLTFTIGNPAGNVTLNGLSFTDNLVAGLVVTGNVTNNGCGGTASSPNASTVQLTGGTLAANTQCTIVVTVQGTTAGVKNNSVTISSTEGGTGNTSNTSVTVLPPTQMTANANTTPQSTPVTQAFGTLLGVTVKDVNNDPVSGVVVTFTAPAQSGASGLFANSTGTTQATTDASGVATATVFTANTHAGGPYNVAATASGLTTVNFALTNTAGSAMQMTANANTTPQSAQVTQAFGTLLGVTVKDGSNNPVQGVTVTFTAPASGASGKFANNTNTTQATTDVNGVATATTFTADTQAGGPYNVVAMATGLTNLNFVLTNTPGPATQMTANANTTPQSGTISTQFGTLLGVTVKDANNNGVSGVVVTFTAPNSGASGTFANNTITTQATTDVNGVATATAFTANTTIGGPYNVAATASGLTTVNFALTNTAGTPTQMSANANTTPQSAQVTTAFGTLLGVTVKDVNNNPVPNVTVTFTAPVSGASGKFANNTNTTQATTDANGVATATVFTANTQAGGPYNVTATASGPPAVNFALTNTAGAATQMAANANTTPQSATVTTAFGTLLGVTVRDVNNNPVPGIVVTFTAPASGASGKFANNTITTQATTDVNGVATASAFTANSQAGGPYNVAATASGLTTVNFALTNTAAGPTQMTANANTTPQSAQVTTAYGTLLGVTVKDAQNNPVLGVTVTFTAPASGASGKFANNTITTQATTDVNGVATATVFTANTLVGGPYNVTATATGPLPVNFVLTNTAGPATQMAANANTTPQSTPVTMPFATPLSVTVRDVYNNGVQGVVVTFTAPASGASGKFANNTITTQATTDINGLATATVFTANAQAGGPYAVSATASGLTTVNFALTNTSGAAMNMTANANTTPQSVAANTPFETLLSVTVKDGGNNPVQGVTVTFTAPASGASGKFANNTITTQATTDANGVATATAFTANNVVGGPYNVTAMANGVTTLNFALTNDVQLVYKPGVFRQGFLWALDGDGDRAIDDGPSPGPFIFAFGGLPGDIPVYGDWNGSGKTKVGYVRNGNQWHLDYNGDRSLDKQYTFGGLPGDIPVVGDWNHDGKSKIGIYRNGIWILDLNGNGNEDPVETGASFGFGGLAGDVPVVGDWNGTGPSKVGVFRQGFLWMLDTDGTHTNHNAFPFGGIAGDKPIVGDWTGTGTSNIGIFRQGFLWILDANGNHMMDDGPSPGAFVFGFGGFAGPPADVPVVGKW